MREPVARGADRGGGRRGVPPPLDRAGRRRRSGRSAACWRCAGSPRPRGRRTGGPRIGGRTPRELLRVPTFRTARPRRGRRPDGDGRRHGSDADGPRPRASRRHDDLARDQLPHRRDVRVRAADRPVDGRVGRRAALVAGCVTSIAGALLAASEANALVIGAGSCAIGLGWSATFLGATAVISDITAPNERAGALGFTDLLVSLTSAAAGPGRGDRPGGRRVRPARGRSRRARARPRSWLVARLREPRRQARLASGALTRSAGRIEGPGPRKRTCRAPDRTLQQHRRRPPAERARAAREARRTRGSPRSRSSRTRTSRTRPSSSGSAWRTARRWTTSSPRRSPPPARPRAARSASGTSTSS